MVDPEAAEVVKRIFSMTIDGYGPYQICLLYTSRNAASKAAKKHSGNLTHPIQKDVL